MVSPMFEHMLTFGGRSEFTEEDLANAIQLDPEQIDGLGPSIESLIALLEERKRKILQTYKTERVERLARDLYLEQYAQTQPPPSLSQRFEKEATAEQLHGLERLWYRADEHTPFARNLLHMIERLGEKYQIDELAARYEFIGRTEMDIPKALAIKEELETIDRLLEQLREARETAQLAVVDMEALAEFAEPGEMDQLRALQQQIQDYLREAAEQQGLELTREGYQLTPKAYRLFQSRLLEVIFEDLHAARRGRHSGPILGEGAVEIERTKPYEFGDSVAHMDVPQSLINAMVREGRPGRPNVKADDIEVHHTRNNPKCATAVIIDMSGSMRYEGQYVNCKRMALALDGLIRTEYPGDFLQFIEMYTFATPRHISEVPQLLPRPVTLYDPVVRLRANMSDEQISEMDVPPHFTNIQHSLQMARQFLAVQDTPNRQIILITDGLPTAHFEGDELFLLYPPHDRTESMTMREAFLCQREQITINVFLLPSWSQSHEDVQFAQRMVEATNGRVLFTGGRDLDRFVIWDYVSNRRRIIG